ncbi:hypothetical protein Q3G72_028222 [Acer saccharum]|nr:hypothetical protein Q3G72_028222 [Acer saccharum]
MSTSIEKEMLQPENKVEFIKLLSSVEDAHGGVTVEMKEPMDSKLFASMLGSSLSYWIQQKKRGVWIKLPIEFSNLVQLAVKEGFRYHHTESYYLMLVKWFPETFDTLPANASHRVGIGAFVMNDNGECMEVDRIVIFSKALTKTDIKARLTVPTDALAHINIPEGGNKVDLSPMDSDGNQWPFRCYTRLNGHPKPAFTTGWRRFVQAKGLQIGDEVTFSKLEDEDEAGGATQYRIHATRAITLWGKQIVVDLPHP